MIQANTKRGRKNNRYNWAAKSCACRPKVEPEKGGLKREKIGGLTVQEKIEQKSVACVFGNKEDGRVGTPPCAS